LQGAPGRGMNLAAERQVLSVPTLVPIESTWRSAARFIPLPGAPCKRATHFGPPQFSLYSFPSELSHCAAQIPTQYNVHAIASKIPAAISADSLLLVKYLFPKHIGINTLKFP